MTYEIAKTQSVLLNANYSAASSALKAFPRTAKGLTPESVKSIPAWQKAKKAYDDTFRELRAFNAIYVKKYKKELAADRLAGRAKLSQYDEEMIAIEEFSI